MTLPAEPRADDYGGHAVYLDWDREFLPWAKGRKRAGTAAGMRLPLPSPWKPGGHWALIGPDRGRQVHVRGRHPRPAQVGAQP